MNQLLALLNDLIVVIFDLIVYSKLTQFKKDTPAMRKIAYGACGLIVLVYIICTYLLHVPSSVASFLCMSLPSFILFWVLSEYKDARFLVTFCMVDTVTLILAFFSRALGILLGDTGSLVGCALAFVFFLLFYLKTSPHFPQYRELLSVVQNGWNILSVSTVFIYLHLVFSAAYPAPLAQRPEFLPVYATQSVMVLSFYAVFISILVQKKRLFLLNEELKKQSHWHRMAYEDPLTQLKNRIAYMERINEISRQPVPEGHIYAVMIDIDNFKRINDTFGHHVGDEKLKASAACLSDAFCEPSYELFRIGGDEFAVIATGISEDMLKEKIGSLSHDFSAGYSEVDPEENNAMEHAFMRADQAMYDNKAQKKKSAAV